MAKKEPIKRTEYKIPCGAKTDTECLSWGCSCWYKQIAHQHINHPATS